VIGAAAVRGVACPYINSFGCYSEYTPTLYIVHAPNILVIMHLRKNYISHEKKLYGLYRHIIYLCYDSTILAGFILFVPLHHTLRAKCQRNLPCLLL